MIEGDGWEMTEAWHRPHLPALAIFGVLMVFIGAAALVGALRQQFSREAAAVVADAERTVVRHDLDHRKDTDQ